MVPARSAILYSLANRGDYKDVTILYGCKNSRERLFIDELREWKEREDVLFMETVDRAEPGEWDGNVGVITTLLPKLENVDPANTYAIIVGPPIVYKFVIISLYDHQKTSYHVI